jgi:predicted negative regulator of RcsB-dependent stress response
MARLHKKDLKQDEFYSTVDRAYVALAENTERWLYPLLGALALLLAVYLGWLYLDHRESRASFFLYEAIQADLDNAPREDVTAKFQTVLDKHPRSDAAEMARWFLAHHQIEKWDRAAALPVVEEFARRRDGFGGLARYKLALLYAAERREAEAEALLIEMLDDPDSLLTPDTLVLTLARLYVRMERLEDAETRYRQMLNDFPTSSLAGAARREMEALPKREAMAGPAGMTAPSAAPSADAN